MGGLLRPLVHDTIRLGGIKYMAIDIKANIKHMLAEFKRTKNTVNYAKNFGVDVIRTSDTSKHHWRCIGVRHLTGAENMGNHNIYCDMLDGTGERVKQGKLEMTQGNLHPVQAVIDKPDNEPGTNFPVWNGDVECQVRVKAPYSDTVVGLKTNHPDDDQGNTIGHHSFLVVFMFVEGDKNPPVVKPTPKPEPAPGPMPEEWASGDIVSVDKMVLDAGLYEVETITVVRRK